MLQKSQKPLIADRGNGPQVGGGKTFLTSAEVQAIAGVSHTCIFKWCRAGKLDAIRVGNRIGYHGGQMRLFSRSEVLRFLAERNRRRRKTQRRSFKRSSESRDG
jgi:hypothetical protein